MTTPLTAELREAAERLMAYDAASSIDRNHCWRQDTGLLINLVEDGCEVARRLLELHPADDGEKIDEAFLESCGAFKEDHPDKWTFGREDSLGIGIWRIDIGWRAVVLYGLHASANLVRPLRTRGDLRRLLAGLQIPLPRPGGEGG
jgi:hypothetical protein